MLHGICVAFLFFVPDCFPILDLFFLYEEYEIIFPLSTALVVSQKSVDDISGESFVSIKDVHSFEISVKVIVLHQRSIEAPSGGRFSCVVNVEIEANW